jgi:hypothetical protein
MLSLVAGRFAVYGASMVIFVSLASKADFSNDSIQIGLSLTTPLIVTLIYTTLS